MSIIDQLRAQRDALQADLEGGIAAVELRGADSPMTDAEAADVERINGEARALDQRIADLSDVEARRQAAARRAPIEVHAEPLTYQRNGEHNYFTDLALAHKPGASGDTEALAALGRLQRHAEEMRVEMPARARRREEAAERELRNVAGEASAFERRTNPNRTDGEGGYFVPPLWLVDEYLPYLRAGRPVVNRLRQMVLPAGTDSINIPKVASGTATGVQTSDGGSVTSTDFTDSYVSAGVKTIAGQQDVALQLVEQSPGGIIDNVVFGDLIADYNQRCDVQSISGSGSSGQVVGLRNLSAPNTVTYTDSDPTVPELWTPLAQALSKIATNRFAVDNVFFAMHPRRWFWIASGLDTANRPLVVPSGVAQNPAGTSDGGVAEGVVGNLVLGPPVVIDANIPTTISSTRDTILAVKGDDTMWFEGNLRTRVLYEVLSGTLQVRFQVYNYVAQLTRYDKSVTLIDGSGLAAPSGF